MTTRQLPRPIPKSKGQLLLVEVRTEPELDTFKCAWCGTDYYGNPGSVCDDCFAVAAAGADLEQRYADECPECGQDGGHFTGCPFGSGGRYSPSDESDPFID